LIRHGAHFYKCARVMSQEGIFYSSVVPRGRRHKIYLKTSDYIYNIFTFKWMHQQLIERIARTLIVKY